MSATPIEPEDIRVGDTIRATFRMQREVWWPGFWPGSDRDTSYELVSRPEPPREPGSLWQDPETNCVYSRTFYGTYTPLGEAGEKLLSQRGWVQMQVSDGSSTALRLVPWTKP